MACTWGRGRGRRRAATVEVTCAVGGACSEQGYCCPPSARAATPTCAAASVCCACPAALPPLLLPLLCCCSIAALLLPHIRTSTREWRSQRGRQKCEPLSSACSCPAAAGCSAAGDRAQAGRGRRDEPLGRFIHTFPARCGRCSNCTLLGLAALNWVPGWTAKPACRHSDGLRHSTQAVQPTHPSRLGPPTGCHDVGPQHACGGVQPVRLARGMWVAQLRCREGQDGTGTGTAHGELRCKQHQ